MAYSGYSGAATAISDKVDAAMTVTAVNALAPGANPSPLMRQLSVNWLTQANTVTLPRLCLAVVSDGVTTAASTDPDILARVQAVASEIAPLQS